MSNAIDEERRLRLKEVAMGRKIPEMQRVKEKYPIYRDLPDGALLQAISRKFPVYSDIANREFGIISKPPSLVEQAKEGFKRGRFMVDKGLLGLQIKEGKISPEEGLNKIGDMERELRRTSHKGATFNLPSSMVKSSAELLPFILKGIEQAAVHGATGAAAGATASLVGGLAPTAPATAAAGFSVGSAYGIIETTRRIEGGNSYLDLINNGIDHDVAAPISEAVGIINGVIETSQIGIIAKRLPGAGLLFKKKIQDSLLKNPLLRKKLLNVAKDFAATVAVETSEEVAQEATSIGGEILASLIEQISKDKEYSGPSSRDAIARMKNVLTASAQGFPLLLLPGSTFQTLSAINSANKARAPRTINATKEDIESIEKGKIPKEIQKELFDISRYSDKKPTIAILDVKPIAQTDTTKKIEKASKKIDSASLKSKLTKPPVPFMKVLVDEKAKKEKKIGSIDSPKKEVKIEDIDRAKRKAKFREAIMKRRGIGSEMFPAIADVESRPLHKPEVDPKTSEERRVKEPKPNGTLEVKIQSLNVIRTIQMTPKQYVDMKESLKDDKSGRVKIISVTPKGSSEAGFARIFDQAKGLNELKNKLGKVLDVEYPFHLISAPETGLQVKTYLSKIMAGQEKALRVVSDLLQFDLSLKDYNRLAFASESLNNLDLFERTRLSPAIDYVRELFDSYFNTLRERIPEKIELPFPESRIKRNETELEGIEKALLSKDRSVDKKGLLARAKELRDENDYFKSSNLKFVHIPLRIWFGDLFKDRSNFRNVLGRKSLSLSTFVEHGYIKEEQVDIRDILASYIRYVEGQLAMADIIDAAKAEGLIKSYGTKGTEDWVSVPSSLTAMLKGKVVHPGFLQGFENYFNSFEGGSPISRVFGSVKMLQFYNPFILPMYDLFQLAMGGSVNLDFPKSVKNAIRQDKNKTSEYWDAYHNGLFSTPFANPFDSFIENLNFEKRIAHSNANLLHKALERSHDYAKNPTLIIRDVYNLSWNVAWGLDRLIRMITYNSLIERGLNPKEAAQLGARFHGDYASVPPKTRKMLNWILFTPTFEIVMNKLYIDMIKGAVSSGAKFFQGKKMGRIESNLTKGLLYTTAIAFGKHIFMTRGLGFKSDEFSRRYFAEIESDFGPREGVVVFANPANLWLRYYYSFKSEELPTNLWNQIARFSTNKAHPLWRIPASLVANKDEGGSPIYNPFDPLPVQLYDQGRFLSTRTVRLLEIIPGMRSDDIQRKQAYKGIAEASNELTSIFLRTIAFVYLRKTRDERTRNQIDQFIREYKSAVRIDAEKIGEENIDREILRNIQRTEKMNRKLDEFLRKEYGD